MLSYQDRNCPREKISSNPISIPKPMSRENSIEYNLKQNFFNPNKFSPPNLWQERLLSRLENYYDVPNKIENLTKK